MDEIKNEAELAEGEASEPKESEEAGANEEVESAESENVETEETEESFSTEESLDFEAELEKERQRLGKKIDKEREKRIEAQKKQGISREEAERIADERVAQAERRLFRGQAETLATRLSQSQAEKELILFHYDNSIIPSGNVEEDIDKAYALANRKKIQGTISELKATVKSKKTLGGASGAGQPAEVKKPQKFSKEIIESAKFAGVSPEEFVKRM